jgi:hypothetical protein
MRQFLRTVDWNRHESPFYNTFVHRTNFFKKHLYKLAVPGFLVHHLSDTQCLFPFAGIVGGF